MAVASLYIVFSFGSLTVCGVVVQAASAAAFWFETWRKWKYGIIIKSASAPSRSPSSVLAAKRGKSDVDRKEAGEQQDHFWFSLVNGLGALVVFITASFFLFYYAEPNGLVVRHLHRQSQINNILSAKKSASGIDY